MRYARFLSTLRLALVLAASAAWAGAQSDIPWDSSGNTMLQGPYNFREVVWLAGDDAGNLRRAVSVNGSITFDGGGAYSIAASVFDSSVGSQQILNTTGTYTIAASGQGFLSSPVLSGGKISGVVSQGIFIASSTEDLINDMFIAAPAGSPLPTDAAFNGNYWVAELNFPSLTISQSRDALFQLIPDGQGNFATVNATGYIGAGKATTQSISGARYSFLNGVASITYGGTPGPQDLLAGNRTLYLSPDGNFIFGGSNGGFNMFVGVRALSGGAAPELLNGLFYQAGADVDHTTLADGHSTLHTYYGAFRARNGLFLGHQRLLSAFDTSPYDYSYSDSYTIGADGTYDDFLGFHNIIGAGGAIKIGFGQQGVPGINVALNFPGLSGPGVFLDPTSILNAASLSPFTAGISRGEMLSLYGSNLANDTMTDGTFPTTLAGVQVFVNGRPAPIGAVSQAQISFLVPYATTEPIAQIKVVNNGTESNSVTAFLNLTSAGVFTAPPGGAGYADAVHMDSTPVTSANPAKPGETIAVRLTGLGDVDPPVADAVTGPSAPQSSAKADIAAFFNETRGRISFAGLAPGLIGLYLMNVTVPSDLNAGDVYLDISGPDSYTSQVQVPIGSKSTLERDSRQRLSNIEQGVQRRGRPVRSARPSASPAVSRP